MTTEEKGPLHQLKPWHLGLLAVGLSALVLHPVSYLLDAPFRLDEAWVAIVTKASFFDLREITASTPIGFTFLIWLIPWPGPQAQRLLPLFFTVGSVIAAGAFARHLGWRDRWATGASLAAAAAVALAPTSVVRNDLKQFTGDAWVALVILALTASIEANWTRKRMTALAAVCVVGAMLSTVSIIVSFVAFGGLTFSALVERDYVRLRAGLFRAFSAGIGIAVVLITLILPTINQALRAFWRSYYLNGSVVEVLGIVWTRTTDTLAPNSGWGALLIPLFCVGVVWMFLSDRPATGVAIVLIWIALLLLGVLDLYPFLDARTSHFFAVITTTVASVGVVVIIRGVWSRFRLAALGLAAIGVSVFFINIAPVIRSRAIPTEDARSQVEHVLSHRDARDIVLVSFLGRYAFSYYWPSFDIVFVKSERVATGFLPEVDGASFVFADDRSDRAIRMALDRSLKLSEARGSERIWIVTSHVNGRERGNWDAAFKDREIQPEEIPVGPEPLLLVEMSPESRNRGPSSLTTWSESRVAR